MDDHLKLRHATDGIPEEEVGSFFAYQLANGDPEKWDYIERNWDAVRKKRFFGLRRIELYLSLKEKPKKK